MTLRSDSHRFPPEIPFMLRHRFGASLPPAARRRSAFRIPLPKQVWGPSPGSTAWHWGGRPTSTPSRKEHALGTPGISQGFAQVCPEHIREITRRQHHVRKHTQRIVGFLGADADHRTHRQRPLLYRPLAGHQELVQGQADRRIRLPHRMAPARSRGASSGSGRSRSRKACTSRSKASRAAASTPTRTTPTSSIPSGRSAPSRSSSWTGPRVPKMLPTPQNPKKCPLKGTFFAGRRRT